MLPPDDEMMPDFMKEDIGLDNIGDSINNRLEGLKELKGCFITSPVDRDYANGLVDLDLFEGDL